MYSQALCFSPMERTTSSLTTRFVVRDKAEFAFLSVRLGVKMMHDNDIMSSDSLSDFLC
jgi:hypothetical protein